MKLKNCDAFNRLLSLRSILKLRNKIGYVAARNYRKLSDGLTEYLSFRDDAIVRYGDMNDDGSYTVREDNLESFKSYMGEYDNIEHEYNLMSVKYEDCIDCLSGEEILAIDWMLEE